MRTKQTLGLEGAVQTPNSWETYLWCEGGLVGISDFFSAIDLFACLRILTVMKSIRKRSRLCDCCREEPGMSVSLQYRNIS